MLKKTLAVWAVLATVWAVSCNNDMMSARGSEGGRVKRDRSQRTVIDNQEYFDFTVPKCDARAVRPEEMLATLNNGVFKNGNSIIKIKTLEQAIEITSDSGTYNGKKDCQVYGKFSIEVKAASSDCLYIRKDPKKEGFVMIDGVVYNNEAVPDLAVCLPLYGYSRNRMELSNIMDGFILMPSGTYWK